jgi:hypothetical protein
MGAPLGGRLPWIQATLRLELNLELARCIRKITIIIVLIYYYKEPSALRALCLLGCPSMDDGDVGDGDAPQQG